MICASLSRLGFAALLCSIASLAVAQQAQPQQRSRTPTQPRQEPATSSSQQRGTTSTTQQKPAPAQPTAQPQKPGAATASGRSAAGDTRRAAGPGGAQATLLASFNDWDAYASGQGRSKICYALSQPKERLPADLKRDPAYLFVSFRPDEQVRNEVAVVMGFATREGAAEATVGQSTYALVTKGPNAWLRNQAEENQVIAAFIRGQSVTVKATSTRGNTTTDRYSLSGFTQALDRARKECS